MKIQSFQINSARYRKYICFLLLCVLIAGILIVLAGSKAHAAQFLNRSVTVDSPVAGDTVQYVFAFDYNSAVPVGSLRFQFCDTPLAMEPCNIPIGLDTQNAALSTQTGEVGYSVYSQTQNTIIMGRSAQAPLNNPSSYTFTNIINPSANSQVVFVRLASFTSGDGTGTVISEGSVATTTTPDVEIFTQVPPVLLFCVATVINSDDCSDMSGNYTDLGELSATETASFTNQIQARTNARSGYTIQMTGNTLSSGIHTIPALSNPTASFVGTGQFGLNLTTNTVPAIGADPSGSGINAIVNPRYNIGNQYLYNDGDLLASTTNSTRSRKFTASYIVNVPENQPLGVYSSTITYVCIGSF